MSNLSYKHTLPRSASELQCVMKTLYSSMFQRSDTVHTETRITHPNQVIVYVSESIVSELQHGKTTSLVISFVILSHMKSVAGITLLSMHHAHVGKHFIYSLFSTTDQGTYKGLQV